MRRLLALVGGAVGGLALYRWLSRRPAAAVRESSPPPVVETEPDARAEELKQRLEESRAIVDERDAFEEAETPVDAAGAADDPDERRRRVHEEGRAAVDRMRGPSEA
jgi:hypothetical protein